MENPFDDTPEIMQNELEVYVGIDADGCIVQIYADLDNETLDNLPESVVSVGIVTAIISDYDEIYKIG